ncbi:MAG TPA: ion transporter [Vicinamibacterales bacterium]
MESVARERWRLLHQIVRMLEPIMAALGLAWAVLVAIDLTRGLGPHLTIVNRAIWVIFAVDFAAEFLIAPKKRLYLKRHWLVAIALALPALRIARLVRIVRLGRIGRILRGAGALRLGQTLASVNRALGALRSTLRRRGFAYVSLATVIVIAVGAAAMYAFENNVPEPQGIHDYWTAVWWTAMLMTTLGPTSWPVTVPGRVLCFLLGLYAFTAFGYVTATLASFFIDRDADRPDTAVAGEKSVDQLRARLDDLQRLLEQRLPARER